MTKILYINGDGDYDAMVFERKFPNMERVAKELAAGAESTTITFEDEEDEYTVTLRVLEFGAIDEDFFAWVMDTFVDYDSTKARNIHILKEDDE